MNQAVDEGLFVKDGQEIPIHCLFQRTEEAGICAEAHYHKYCEILYGVDCDTTVWVRDRLEQFGSGDVCFFYPGEPHFIYSERENNQYYVMKFSPEILYHEGQLYSELCLLFPIINGNPEEHRHVLPANRVPKEVAEIVKSIFCEWEEEGIGSSFVIRGQILRLYTILLRVWDLAGKVDNYDESFRVIHQAVAYTNQNLDTVTESYLAEKCYMSNSYFSKTFKKVMGKSYQQFLTDTRVEDAKRRLAVTEQSVTEISMATGFSSASHFISCFRRQVGVTPKQYRNAFRKKMEDIEGA